MADSIIKGYYEDLKKNKLIGKKCASCGKITFPPTTLCEHCGSRDVEPFALSGEGELLYVSHSMAPPPNPRFNGIAPYAYGHVKLAEGVFVQGIITGVSRRAIFSKECGFSPDFLSSNSSGGKDKESGNKGLPTSRSPVQKLHHHYRSQTG